MKKVYLRLAHSQDINRYTFPRTWLGIPRHPVVQIALY